MKQINIRWEWKKFKEMPVEVLYRLLQLRSEVFVVEQRCAYQDLDDKDQTALHLLGWVTDEKTTQLAAAARVLFPQDCGKLSFGRVVVAPSFRGLGYGDCLVAEILKYLQNSSYHKEPITISAQHHLIDFYCKFGFQSLGDPYDEDGIIHIKMLK